VPMVAGKFGFGTHPLAAAVVDVVVLLVVGVVVAMVVVVVLEVPVQSQS